MATALSRSWLRALISKIIRVGSDEMVNRRALRLIAGTGVTLTPQDSALSDETRVTITSSTVAFTNSPSGGTFLPYRIERALYSGKTTGSMSAFSQNMKSVLVNPDQTRMFLMYEPNTTNSCRLTQWTMSVPGDIETATLDGEFVLESSDSAMEGVCFNAAGTRLYAVGSANDAVYQWNLGTAWEIVSDVPVSAGASVSIAAQTLSPRGINISPDGTTLIVLAATSYQYTLSTPDEIVGGSMSYASISLTTTSVYGTAWGQGYDGTPGGRLFYANISGIGSLVCPTPYSLSGASVDPAPIFDPPQLSAVYGVCFLDDGLRMWVASNNSYAVCEYYTSAVVPAQ